MSENEEIMNYIKRLESRIEGLESIVERLIINNDMTLCQIKKCLDTIIEAFDKKYGALNKQIDIIEKEQIDQLWKSNNLVDKKIDVDFKYLEERIDRFWFRFN